MGIPLGTLAGMVFGGLIADRFGWRAALLVAGIPGLLLAILARLTLREVREPAAGAGGKGDGADLWQSLRTLWGKHCFRWAVIGATLTAFISYGQAAFVASFFLRNHGETVAVAAAALQSSWGITLGPVGLVGVGLGLVIGLAGVAGTAAGGALTDRLAVRDQTAYMTVPAWAALLGVVAFLGMLFTSALWLAALWCCATMFLKYMWSGPVFAVVQTVAPPDSRATASAVLLFVVNIVGLGLGPLAVGVASDLLAPQFGSGAGLRLAMAGSASAGLLSAAAFWIARRTVVAEMGA
jgi:predicted MFS family arabinose efflux permease